MPQKIKKYPVQVNEELHKKLMLLKMLLGKKRIEDVIADMVSRTVEFNHETQKILEQK